jgi:hypothetical protein
MKQINCYIPFVNREETLLTVNNLKQSTLVNKIFLLTSSTDLSPIENCSILTVNSNKSTETIKQIIDSSDAEYTLIYTKSTELELGQYALDRFLTIASDTKAGLVYSDYYQIIDQIRSNVPLIDYQQGSLRDDFNFGSVLFYSTNVLKSVYDRLTVAYNFAGLYDLRLKVSQLGSLIHINEYLYTEIEYDNRKSGEKQFDYVDPKNREVQLEMEQACTSHLKAIGAFLKPEFQSVNFNNCKFDFEASVIIPVRNRVKTIEDAIKSVISQKAEFDFNLIIIDNFSTDGTSELIQKYALENKNIIHLIPERKDLGIGGCWNVGIQSIHCGKFAVQLDSDDVYQDSNTLQKIVDAFYTQNCAMVVGSYTMTNFNMETIPPGLIDHKEWTPDNGRNNALRINGLGAPRAFFTPVLRELKVPNTSYGEDYALGLYFSRRYQIGRIYESLYLCRRWDENSDASLDVSKMNQHNLYKDKIRTLEIIARKNLNIQ